MDNQKIKITIEYDGLEFYGWQRQPNLRTVQGEICNVLSELAGREVLVEGSGRTDAGVHAVGQVASFDWKKSRCVPVQKLRKILNNRLPSDIWIKNLEIVDYNFHARFSAIAKTYKYILLCSDEKETIAARGAYVVPSDINIKKIIQATQHLVGKHDFKSFMASGSYVKDTVRTIYDINIEQEDSLKKYLHIYFTGNGFLYNMVRIITGLLIDIGMGKKDVNDIPSIIKACDRTLVEHTAAAKGLYLMRVYYSEDEIQKYIK